MNTSNDNTVVIDVASSEGLIEINCPSPDIAEIIEENAPDELDLRRVTRRRNSKGEKILVAYGPDPKAVAKFVQELLTSTPPAEGYDIPTIALNYHTEE